jgi:tetratricopeptide (TPR) repeat protein
LADLFVSYTSSNREWAHWIALELKRLGHVPHVHEWEIDAGGDIAAWMEQRLQEADRVLCVISADYLTKGYSGWERRSAQWAAASGRPNFLLPVFVEDCEPPITMANFKRCALFGLGESDARARLKAYLSEAHPPAGPLRFPGEVKTSNTQTEGHEDIAFPGGKFALSNIPIGIPRHFFGREDAFDAIDAAFKRYEGRVAITALHGLRGVGKTTLAAAYADRRRADFRATWWIRAQTPDTMRADLVSLGVRLGWVAADEKEEPALDVVRQRLRPEGEGLLLIYDNAVDAASLTPYLPIGGAAHILITSNTSVWRGIAAPVPIRLWPRQVGADYLIARTGRERERAEAEALSEELDGLPLAHEQAGAYCERLGVSFAEYRKRFEVAPARLLDADRDAPAVYHDRLTAAKAFALAIDEAAKRHPAAEPLITYAALLAPEPIPLFLFSDARETFGEPLASALAGDGLDEAVAALRDFALVDRETIADERDPSILTDAIRLHRLVRIAAATRRRGGAAEARRVLVEAMAAVYPRTVFFEPNDWPRARRLDALVLDLVGGQTALPNAAEAAAGYLLDRLGTYRVGALAAYKLARPLLERSLAIREQALGSEHPDTAMGLNSLGVLLRVQGEYVAARALFNRALAIYEKALGPEHPSTAIALNNLALVLKDLGDLSGARYLFYRVLFIREKALGSEHPDTALSLKDIALLLGSQGDFAGARQLHERALATFEKALGPNHPETAASLDNLATSLHVEGNLTSARALFERALVIREKALGPEHTKTALSLNNLAGLLQAQGDLAGARPLFERALAILEKALGPAHPDTIRVRFNLVSLSRAVRKPSKG